MAKARIPQPLEHAQRLIRLVINFNFTGGHGVVMKQRPLQSLLLSPMNAFSAGGIDCLY
jgi:hypothetical protein